MSNSETIERLMREAAALRERVREENAQARREEREWRIRAAEKRRAVKKLERRAARAACSVRVVKTRVAERAKCAKKKASPKPKERKQTAARRIKPRPVAPGSRGPEMLGDVVRPKALPAARAPLALPSAPPLKKRRVTGIKRRKGGALAASPGQRRARAKERAATLTRDELIALQFAIAQAEEEAQDAEDREDLRAASRHRARAMDLKAQLTGVKKPTSAAASAPRTSIGPSVWMPTATARIASLKSVLRAKAWTKVPGKERIYVDLTKMNGGANWNQGIGHRVIVFADGSVRLDEQNSKWAGARTRDWHHENKTLKKISDAVADARGVS